MNIALYIEPNKTAHNSFYNNLLLRQSFLDKGHQFDIYIGSPKASNDDKNPFSKINHLEEFYNIELYNNFPKEKNYDILFVYEDNCKKWYKKDPDARRYIAQKFQALDKKVICLKFDTIFEYRPIELDNIIYGVCSDQLTPLANRFHWIIGNDKKRFTMPVIANISHPKPNTLTRDEFYQKYDLDPEKKIIAYLPGKIKKWRKKDYIDNNKLSNYSNNFNQNFAQSTWFYDNIDTLVEFFSKMGYQLVGKLHVRDSDKFLKNNPNATRYDVIKYVDQYHTHELLKYSDFAIIFGTTMVYQLYLYNLPVLEIGTGIYYPSWADTHPNNKNHHTLSPLAQWNFGKDLIYGQIVSFDKLKADPVLYLTTFIKKLQTGGYPIKEFKYRKDHPLYGKSYGSSIEDITNIILKAIETIG